MDKKEFNWEEIKSTEEELEWYKKKYGPRIEKRGMHNVKNLFRKPNLNEWLVFFCIVMCLTLTVAYKMDMRACNEQVNDILDNPHKYSQIINWSNNNEIQGNSEFIPFPLQVIQGLLT